MKNANIIRYWKDQEYRNTINENEASMIPDNPVANFMLSDDELRSVSGAGGRTFPENAKFSNTGCCHMH